MNLAHGRRAVAQAEARLADASQHLRRSWGDLQQEGNAALTPGRVVLAGLLSGFFSGTLAGGGKAQSSDRPGQSGESLSIILDLLRIGGSLLPLLLPGLAPAFRAGVAAGSGRATKPQTTSEPSANA